MIQGHRIAKKIDVQDFLGKIRGVSEKDIETTGHTFFRLAEKQRKIFKEKIIKEIVLSQDPFLVGIQYNGNYAAFYAYDKDVLKIILDIQHAKINIVTFYIVDQKQIPKL